MTITRNRDYWHSLGQRLPLDGNPVIDGKRTPSSASTTMPGFSPALGDILYHLPEGSAADVDRAVDAARQAFGDGRWQYQPPLARKAVLLRLAELVDEHHEELALMDCLEMGKTISDALGDVSVAAGFFRFYAEAIDKMESPVVASARDTLAFNLYEPLGVVGAIVPWNYPVINAALKAAPILAMGNSLVLKPSEIASLSALRLADLALEAGLPDGVMNVVPGLGTTVGAAISGHGDIDMVTFTGSTLTGRTVMAAAAGSNGKRVALECGGKSPQLVFGDMGRLVDDIAVAAAGEAFANQGQLCVARTRLLVERSLRDDLVGALDRVIETIEPGDPLDPDTRFGAIASPEQWAKIKGYIDGAVREGARSLKPIPRLDPDNGLFIPPVVFTGTDPSMAVVREEVFGPVLTVQTFDTLDEAVMLANDTIYGLAATAWSRDHGVLHGLMRRLDAGKVTLRSSATPTMKAAFSLGSEPFKQSGFGVE
ncbi:MAG: aldehyde dehydrogenase family protein, partial [Sphingomonadales bacterium]